MGRHHHRRRGAGGYAADAQKVPPQTPPRFARPDRRLLLAGTALATSFLVSSLIPTAAEAQQAVNIASIFPVNVTNNDDCIFIGTCASIITGGIGAPIDFTNTGNFATLGLGAIGIATNTAALGGSITINNSGNLATAGIGAIGIEALTVGPFSPIKITNTGDLATAGAGAIGISANTSILAPRSPITINNSGDIATAGLGSIGIFATTASRNSRISINNSGDIATIGTDAYGIYAYTGGSRSNIAVTNSGAITTRAYNADGIQAYTDGTNSDISIINSGDINTRGGDAEGIVASTYGLNSQLSIVNSGRIRSTGAYAEGIYAYTEGVNADMTITNSGDIETRGGFSSGIDANTYDERSSLTIVNSGQVSAQGRFGYGIYAQTYGPSSPIEIRNSGEIFGSMVGIAAFSNTSTTILNSGKISAGSGLAIDSEGASTRIENTGLITGFVDLTDSGDTFRNRAGGTFNASETSDFGGGRDVFANEAGGTLRAADDFNASEETKFVGLERFENQGLITMVDGKPRDVLRLSNTPGGTNLSFFGAGGGKSRLAIDTFLGGPGSTSDVLVVEGNTGGRTRIDVNNTNRSSARFDPVGIPVVFVDGNVDAKDFYIDKPIDAGFFDYDLFFVPTGSGFFELKNHTGGGAHVLPQLVTVTHDTFHNTTETWFDQSTDLRVLLARGNLCDDPGRAEDVVRCQELYNFTPGVWARGAGSWFDIDDSATTKANGRTYRHDLKRDLDIWQVQSGIDFGKRDLFVDGDVLVLGVLGGAVESTLDYESLVRRFQVSSLEAGAYATYLRGGLFVDTLFKTLFSTIDTDDVRGFPNELDSTTYGFRTDTGYRFGGMRPGPFIEPLATIAASWTHIDDFSLDGNAIDFDDDEDVRGRLGMRLGTSTEVWEGTTMEPFAVGSVWGSFSGDHNATLTSTGRDFQLVDETDDVWGEVSAGVNFFNPGAQTAVFAKVDYVFADEAQGTTVKGGMRYNW
ncbi:MAG: autotransporter outer membrane beta-barrel domain-containing protein [Methyloceanibacter sp.]|uniref:autotransporter outer membrane beta-barrel domain-containing protein n=1 Tax=Methyloceanibacter sp. TaxID=1965321 RepID=UPI003EDEA772